MYNKTLFTLLILFLPFLHLKAQVVEPDDYALRLGVDTFYTSVNRAFEAYQSPLAQDPGLPAFTFISRNKRVALGIGGFVRFVSFADFGGVVDDRNFVTFKIPLEQTFPQKSQFGMHITTTLIYARLLADTPLGVLHFYIDTDFESITKYNRFAAIYGTLRGWRVGRYWSLMTDLASFPPTVDYQGPNSFSGLFTYQVSYEKEFRNGMKAGAGLDWPDVSINDSLINSSVSQKYPSLPFYVQYKSPSWGHVRLSGIYRIMQYRYVPTNSSRYVHGWGGILSSKLTVIPKTSIYMQLQYGSGVANYIFDLNGNGLDLVPRSDDPFDLDPLASVGGFIGIKYDFTKKLFSSVTFSQLRTLPHNGQGGEDFYKFTRYVIASLNYAISPKLQCALEYNYGDIHLRNGEDGKANRIAAMLRYDF